MSEERPVDLGALRVVGCDVPDEDQGALLLLPRLLKRPDDAQGVLPAVEPGDLDDQGEVGRDAVVLEALIDGALGKFPVHDGEGIDPGREEDLRPPEIPQVLPAGEDDGVVPLDERDEVVPDLPVRRGEVEVAAPHPGAFLPVMGDQRERLRVVDEDHVVVDMVPHGVLVDDVLVDLLLPAGEVDLCPLEGVMKLLCHAEEVRGAVDDAPPGLYAEAVCQERQGREDLGYPAAVVGGVHVQDVHVVERPCLRLDAAYDLFSDVLFVVPDGVNHAHPDRPCIEAFALMHTGGSRQMTVLHNDI